MPADAPAPDRRMNRELRYFLLFAGFGLLVLPFLVYLAGVVSLGPYEGGLLAFLVALYGAFFTLQPSAWALLLGPYALFWVVRLMTRPLRRRAGAGSA
ncbi:MAG: hypothetical protein H6R27_64 [Proteobacteria bacterium]|nr:hypothetical protein [Pseudomonadota bacterium]